MNNHASFHTSHVLYRPYQTKKKRNEKGRKNIYYQKGGTPLHDFWESHYAHMVLTVMRQVQGPFDWNFICSKTAGICGINLRSTTVVCWRVHSPMGDPSSRVENKKRKKKKGFGVELPQSKIWDSISSVSILKWEKSSWWRWMIFRKWRIEVCWTAPWFFNLWINSRVFGRKSENSRVDLAIRRNSPTIAE